MSEEWKYDENSGSFRRQNTPQKSDSDWGSWALIGFLFLVGLWPVGLAMLILKLKETPTKKTAYYNTAARSTESTVRQQERTSGVRRTPQRTATRETSSSKVTDAAKKVTRTPSDTSKTARVLQIVGIIIMAMFGMGLGIELESLLTGIPDWSALFTATGFFAGGLTMFLSGRKMKSRQGRAARYLAIMGERDFVTLDELSMVSGNKRSAVEHDIEYMLQKNLLGTGAFVDAGHGILFRSADAYQRYLKERTQKENLTPKEAQEGYSGALRAIREANDRIPDPVFSEKLDHMEAIAGRIFKEVEAHPEKQKQASTFFDYYLPTTLKLLATYTQFEEAGIEGENLRQAKARIESIMDTLLENFEKQLDELYRSEAMDVDADIRVMETMLDRDLSSVERDFGLNGGSAVQTKPN